MGLFERDLKYEPGSVKDGIQAITDSKDYVKDTITNIKAQLDIINNMIYFISFFSFLHYYILIYLT